MRIKTIAAASAALVGASLLGGFTAAADAAVEEAPEATQSSFLLPIIPDTQFYSRYSAEQFYPQYGTNPFEVQTQWIVDHQDELDIPFAVHVGDVVDQQGVTGQWDAAERAMGILEDGGVPYSVLPGNHDVADMNARSSVGNSANYLASFGQTQLAAQGGSALIGTFEDGLSSAYLFEAEGHQWMSLAIAWNASDATFDWAQGILDAHPGVPVVLSSHAIINIAEDQLSPASWWWGDLLWDELITKNDQIVVTVNGHFHGATMRTQQNDFGHDVYQVLTDYQMAADGGNGYMTLFEFDLTNDRIDVESVSPWVTQKHEDSLTSSDTPVLDGTWQSYSVPLDFSERFGWDEPTEATGPDLSELAKQIVSEGWDGDAAGGALEKAGAADDYIAVDGTVAHWRFGEVAAGVVDETSVIPDVVGDSPMYRSAPDATDATDELEDVQVTHENTAYYSSDAGAVCFAPVYRNDQGPDRLAYLSTEYGAPATFADLDEAGGYTIETFLQLDADWTETANRWSAALTRGGTREWVGIDDSSDPGAGVSWLGISSLREYQFSAADTATADSYTLWSGEIMPAAWHHVAVVSDPDAGTVIMYVDGVPVLRNASGAGGMVAADYMPWIIGTSTWNTEADHGWHGCVGETRIVDHALDESEFLYNRIDIDGDGANFSVVDAPQGELASGTSVGALSGTGYPGAQVRIATADPSARAAGDLGSTEVGADGRWRIVLAEPLAGAGVFDLALTQSIGTRDGSPYALSFSIAEDVGTGADTAADGPGADGAAADGAAADGAAADGAGSDGAGSDGAGSDGAGSDGATSAGADDAAGAGSAGADDAAEGSGGAGSDAAGADSAGSDGAAEGADGAGSDGAAEGADGAGSDGAVSDTAADGTGSDTAADGADAAGAEDPSSEGAPSPGGADAAEDPEALPSGLAPTGSGAVAATTAAALALAGMLTGAFILLRRRRRA
ncbi:LamG-like jellyroll fold domain-containing protein [Microbacterium gilvum]|uniref:Gram-positive cocci surface proteins LPxTG domain-containing protein n=1 Tax=Microbacterium gilvum TaxID=1336204 RepID=A0ABP9AHI1_9MICO